MTIIEGIANWACELGFEKIPSRVVEKAKLQILSVIAAVHAGIVSPSSRKLLTATKKWDTGGTFPVLATGDRLSLHNALFANTSLCMAHDYDDYLFLGHTGHSAVFTSLLVGNAQKSTLKDMIVAQTIGNEVGGRLGASCVIGPQNGQLWTFIHLVESALCASKLLKLDADRTAHAIAISLYQPNFALFPGFMGPDSKILSASQTSVWGLTSALLAKEGFTGALDIIEHEQGFLAQFSYAPLEFMFRGLGRSWVSEAIAYKLVPGCAYIDSAVDAMAQVLEKFKQRNNRNITPRDIKEIEVKTSILSVEMNALSAGSLAKGELNPIAINFSIPANLAIMVLTGDLKVDYLHPDWLELHKEDILSLCKRIKIAHDWSMTIEIMKTFNKVLDLRKIAHYVGISRLISARRKASKHYGAALDFSFKEFSRMRRASRTQGLDYFANIAGALVKNFLSPKRKTMEPTVPDLGECDFSKLTMPFAAEVTVRTADWKEYSATVEIPLGAPGRSWDETVTKVKEKFARECARNLTQHEITNFMEKLYENNDIPVTELIELVTRRAEAGEEKKQKGQSLQEADLPPIIFEPLKHFEPRHHEKKEPDKVEKLPIKDEKKEIKTSVAGRMRRAKPGEKTPKPPKSTQRKRPRRP